MKNLKTIFASFEEKAKSAKVQRVLLTGATAFALTPRYLTHFLGPPFLVY